MKTGTFTNPFHPFPDLSPDLTHGLNQVMRRRCLRHRLFSLLPVVLVVLLAVPVTGAVLGPIVIGSLAAYLLYPVVTLMKNALKIPHLPGSILLLTFIALAGVGVSRWVIPGILSQAAGLGGEIMQARGGMEAQVLDWFPSLEHSHLFGEALGWLDSAMASWADPGRVFRILISSLTRRFLLAATLAISGAMLIGWPAVQRRISAWIPASYQEEFGTIVRDLDGVWRAFFRGQLWLMIFIGVFSGAAAMLLGLRSAMLLAFISGTLELIPSAGPMIATGLAALSAWTDGSAFLPVSNMAVTIAVICVFSLIQLAEFLWIQPMVLSRHTHIHPLVIFISILAALTFGSALLAIVIVPLIGTVMLARRSIDRMDAVGRDRVHLGEVDGSAARQAGTDGQSGINGANSPSMQMESTG
jgi:predicted PurR-regulated permease PerM